MSEALFRSVLLPLVTSVAEACGGFDWDDAAFESRHRGLARADAGRWDAGRLAEQYERFFGTAVGAGRARPALRVGAGRTGCMSLRRRCACGDTRIA